jgi:diguanylate cyclase (GGDEF)-like protein
MSTQASRNDAASSSEHAGAEAPAVARNGKVLSVTRRSGLVEPDVEEMLSSALLGDIGGTQASRNDADSNSERAGAEAPALVRNGKVLSVAGRGRLVEQDVEEMLSSALLASDSELGGILREVDEITKGLDASDPDKQTLRVAIHPAVWGAVRQALLDRELRRLALTDDLTCLYNRRGFFAAATQQLKLALRNQHCLLLFFFDLDELKKINDSFGHAEGDLAITRAADVLEATFRRSDILARLGGDEFAVLASETCNRTEGLISRRLENNLRKGNKNEPRYQLSFSLGVAKFDPKRAVSLGELMAEADQAMYERKRSRLTACVPQPATFRHKPLP